MKEVKENGFLELDDKDLEQVSGGWDGCGHPVSINEDCFGCGQCLRVCPMGCLSPSGDKYVVDQDMCIGCGECIDECPVDAIG